MKKITARLLIKYLLRVMADAGNRWWFGQYVRVGKRLERLMSI
jgi:hypothetical protein